MTVDQKAQVANAREEQQMSNENDEQNRAEVACPRCAGCGQLADSDDREPWSVWMALPVGSALAVTTGLVKPEPCDECGGTGKVPTGPTADDYVRATALAVGVDPDEAVAYRRATDRTQPAGEHHTGTLDLTGEGNAPAAGFLLGDGVIEEAAQAACEYVYPPKTHQAWDEVDDFEQDAWRATANVVLEAAYPAIRQQVAEEIAAKANEIAEAYQKSAEYYRTVSLEVGSGEPKGQRFMRTALAFKNNAAGAWAVMHAARDIGGEA